MRNVIKFDFKTYVNNFVDDDNMNKILNRKAEIYNKFNNATMIGWTEEFNKRLLEDILNLRDYIKNNYDCLVILGIGGSFLGSYALKNMFTKYFSDNSFEVIYAGCDLSSKYLSELIEYLDNKNFAVNVISKSGTTMETMIAYDALKQLIRKKYNSEEIKNRIIITTDESVGKLREEVIENDYKSFIIPSNIGGRYSLITAAHLLPLSFFLDINNLVTGFYDGLSLTDEAYNYACIRRCFFDLGKYVENFCVFEPNMIYYTEWLKQLFGETEGKEKRGIFPVSTLYTRDLHSLGQFIQEGNPIIFETFIKVLNTKNFYVNDKNLNNLNGIVLDSVVNAHYSGGVACNIIEIDEINEMNIGKLCAFFMLSAAYSGYLFDVDPFNQPGVEVYKKFIRDNLDHFKVDNRNDY